MGTTISDPTKGFSFLDEDLKEIEQKKLADAQAALADKATLNPYAGAALQGATFGFGDELTAGVRSVLGSTPYGEALDQERAGHKQFSDAHPWQNVGMQVVGAIPHMLVTRGKSGEAVAGDVAATVAPKFWAGVRSAGLRGGIEGAGQGFGEGEGGPGEDKSVLGRFGSAAEGALAGTVGGAAFDIIGHGVKEGAKALWNRFGPAVSDKAALTAAQAKLAQNITREGGLPMAEQKLADYSTQLAENTAAGLPNARLTLGEIVGGQPRAAMDAAVQIPGKGAAEVARDITAREGERLGRVRSALTSTFGDLDGAFTAKTKLYDERKAAADPLYNAAFANAKPLTAGDVEYFQRVPKGAIDYAQQLAQADGRRLSFVPRFDEQGRMINNDLVPTPEDMHHIKTGLDMFLQANTDAITGKPNQLAGKFAAVRDMIRDRLDTLTTGDDGNSLYKAARETWAGPTAKADALDLGARAGKMRPDELAAKLASMTEAERAFAVQGWMGKVNADLDAVHQTGHANPVRQVFSTQEQKDTARAMLGAMGMPDEEVARRFTQLSNYFAHEGVGAGGEQQLMRGSQTASRGAWMKDLGLSTIPTISAGVFDPKAALAVGATLAAGVGTKALNASRTEKMNTQMLRMLGSTVPAEQMAAVNALREAAARRAAPVSPYHTSIAGTVGGQVGADRSPGYLPGILDPDHPDVRR